jgi:hypothetical protein
VFVLDNVIDSSALFFHFKELPLFPWQRLHSTRRRLFLPATGIKFEEETSKMLHLEHGCGWC